MKALAWSIFLSTFFVCVSFGREIPESEDTALGVTMLIGVAILIIILAFEK